MFHLTQPAPDVLVARLFEWRSAPLSYVHKGGIERPPRGGFVVDAHEVFLGNGAGVFHEAGRALDAWTMFPAWAEVARTSDGGAPGSGLASPAPSAGGEVAFPPSQAPGQIVAMTVRICGLWWVNPCRILRRCDGARTHGFVYGTLPEHAECGEEQFVIEWRADDSVWYVIRAFSRPRHWMAWAAFPLARWWQCRFVRDSQRRMQAAV